MEALQDPRNMVKVVLPEPQLPVMLHTSPASVLDDGAIANSRKFLGRLLSPDDGHWAMSPGKGANGTPTLR